MFILKILLLQVGDGLPSAAGDSPSAMKKNKMK